MTVIIKELVVKTSIVEHPNYQKDYDTAQLKNEVVKECLHKLKKTSRKSFER